MARVVCVYIYGGEGGIYTLALVTGRLIYVHVLDCVCVHVFDKLSCLIEK